MVLLQRELYFSKDPEGVQHFPVGGGSNFFQGGGGSEPPITTMDPHINTGAVILIETRV